VKGHGVGGGAYMGQKLLEVSPLSLY